MKAGPFDNSARDWSVRSHCRIGLACSSYMPVLYKKEASPASKPCSVTDKSSSYCVYAGRTALNQAA